MKSSENKAILMYPHSTLQKESEIVIQKSVSLPRFPQAVVWCGWFICHFAPWNWPVPVDHAGGQSLNTFLFSPHKLGVT